MRPGAEFGVEAASPRWNRPDLDRDRGPQATAGSAFWARNPRAVEAPGARAALFGTDVRSTLRATIPLRDAENLCHRPRRPRAAKPLHAVDAISINNYLSGGGSHRIARPLECFVSRGPRRESAAARQCLPEAVVFAAQQRSDGECSQRCCTIEISSHATPGTLVHRTRILRLVSYSR